MINDNTVGVCSNISNITDKAKVYNIGETIEFIQDSWGSIYPRLHGKKLIEGEKVITVEVKDIKTVMVTLDYPVRNIYEEQENA